MRVVTLNETWLAGKVKSLGVGSETERGHSDIPTLIKTVVNV
jgi:hypothetical protein